ncbi:MAG: hypothetical protein KBT04_01540 [Bacteroidales bacterium]|nr:hypothetical protein [Candidatus Colimorpha onthohippi]
MTKKIIPLLALLVAIICVSCGKEKNCRCSVTSTDKYATVTSSEVIINVDGNLKCKNITSVGDEWMSRDGYTSSDNQVSCDEL